MKNEHRRARIRSVLLLVGGLICLFSSAQSVHGNFRDDIYTIAGIALLIISLSMIFLLWLEKKPTSSYVSLHDKQDGHLNEAYLVLGGKQVQPIMCDEQTTLQVIGKAGGMEANFEYICVVRIKDKIIPFFITSPFILTHHEDIPVISIAIERLGTDILTIPTHARDYRLDYDKTIFAEQEEHGYHFESEQERDHVCTIIREFVPYLFLRSTSIGKPLAYCVEVLMPTAQHTQLSPLIKDESINYRDMAQLCDSIRAAIHDGSTPWYEELRIDLANYLTYRRNARNFISMFKDPHAVEWKRNILRFIMQTANKPSTKKSAWSNVALMNGSWHTANDIIQKLKGICKAQYFHLRTEIFKILLSLEAQGMTQILELQSQQEAEAIKRICALHESLYATMH